MYRRSVLRLQRDNVKTKHALSQLYNIMDIKTLYQTYLHHPQICTDTRKITEGCLFFCLKGENFDGNAFARQAAEAGASCVVTTDASLSGDSRFFVVEDTLATLQELALYHRQQLSIPVIGVRIL